jgi:hypothetical protein
MSLISSAFIGHERVLQGEAKSFLSRLFGGSNEAGSDSEAALNSKSGAFGAGNFH